MQSRVLRLSTAVPGFVVTAGYAAWPPPAPVFPRRGHLPRRSLRRAIVKEVVKRREPRSGVEVDFRSKVVELLFDVFEPRLDHRGELAAQVFRAEHYSCHEADDRAQDDLHLDHRLTAVPILPPVCTMHESYGKLAICHVADCPSLPAHLVRVAVRRFLTPNRS